MAGVVAVTDGAKTSLMKRMKEREVRRETSALRVSVSVENERR